jgi:tripartite-type tricarboxylate transporter receptor subunit TctC
MIDKSKLAACACALFVLPLTSGAQSYPAKPVRVVIPWPGGGGVDTAGRVVMQKLSATLGQQFVIDNRPGAAGTIGASVVAKSPGDGYTLMVHSTTHVGNASFYKKLPYDTLGDFSPIALICSQPGVLVVHPSLPARSVKEFIALARAKPREILYASSGNGSSYHLSMALLTSMAGIDLVHVPYKGGPPAVTSILSGETQAILATIAVVRPHLPHKLRPLAVASAARVKLFPDLPTIAEAGVPGYEMSPWIGVFAPAGTPRDIAQQLNSEVNKTLALPDVAQNLSNQAFEPWPSTIPEFEARLKADYQKYAKLVKLTGAGIQ